MNASYLHSDLFSNSDTTEFVKTFLYDQADAKL